MSIRVLCFCVVLSFASGSVTAQAARPSIRDSIQYRFADAVVRPTARRYTDARTGRSYTLKDTVVLDGRGFDSVEVRVRRIGDNTVADVIARLRPSASAAFAIATANHLGQLLVVTLGDHIVAAATIESRLGSVVPVMTGVGRSVAESLAVRINEMTIPYRR